MFFSTSSKSYDDFISQEATGVIKHNNEEHNRDKWGGWLFDFHKYACRSSKAQVSKPVLNPAVFLLFYFFSNQQGVVRPLQNFSGIDSGEVRAGRRPKPSGQVALEERREPEI